MPSAVQVLRVKRDVTLYGAKGGFFCLHYCFPCSCTVQRGCSWKAKLSRITKIAFHKILTFCWEGIGSGAPSQCVMACWITPRAWKLQSCYLRMEISHSSACRSKGFTLSQLAAKVSANPLVFPALSLPGCGREGNSTLFRCQGSRSCRYLVSDKSPCPSQRAFSSMPAGGEAALSPSAQFCLVLPLGKSALNAWTDPVVKVSSDNTSFLQSLVQYRKLHWFKLSWVLKQCNPLCRRS